MVVYCCVNECKNNGNAKNEEPKKNILFHAFPSNSELKTIWLKAIGRPDWVPPDYARICSDHYTAYQLTSNFASTLMQMCRICLATDDITLYSLQDGQLQLYVDTVFPISNDSHIQGLPQFVCYECAVRLRKCYNMIKKCETSQTILFNIFAENGEITKSLVKNLNRENLELKSPLEPHNVTPTYLFQYAFNYEQNLSYLTGIEYIYDINERIKKEANIDIISIKNDDIDAIKNKPQGTDDIKSANDNVLYFENVAVVEDTKEYSIYINEDVEDVESTGLSEESEDSTHENSKNVSRSDDELVQNSKVTNETESRRSRIHSAHNESKDAIIAKHFNVIKFMTLQEKIDDWHKSMETPYWLSKKANVPKVYKCELCSKIFANSKTHEQHSKLHDPVSGKMECPVCKIRCKHQRGLQHHMQSIHSKKYCCKSCPKMFSNWTMAEKHYSSHIGRVYKCKQCSFSNRHRSQLSEHIRNFHCAFACELCGRGCVNRKGLEQHRRHVHSGETIIERSNDYSCEQCNFSFRTEEALRVHLLTSMQHKETKKNLTRQNTCRYCGQKFSSFTDLRAHIKSDHNNTVYFKSNETVNKFPAGCEHCHEIMQSRKEYYWHMRREHPHVPYQQESVNLVCEICGQGFKNVTHLERHILRHGSPNLPCPICKKLFYDSAQLESHVTNKHCPEKPYACETCGAAFKNRSNLHRHIKIHTDVTPFECDLCGKKLKHRTSVVLHIRSVHHNIKYPSVLNRKKRTRKRDTNTNSPK